MIIEARGDTIVLRGAIGVNIWPAIQAAAALLLKEHPAGIIIDCSALTRVTSKGAETFADAFSYIQSHNSRIVVAGLSKKLAEVAKTAPGVRALVPLADSVEDARTTLRSVEVTLKKGKARVRAVVPMAGNWRRAVMHADKLAIGEDCEIHLVDLIRVPRTLPLGSPLPEREVQGRDRLDAAAAVVRDTRLKSFTHVERVRSETTGLSDFVRRLEADFAVISIDRSERSAPFIEEPEAISLMETADFELSLIKGAPAGQAGMGTRAVVPALGAWQHAVEHACKLLRGQDGTVTVVYLVAIPRQEAINAPRPDADAAVSDCAKQALTIGRKYGVEVNAIIERVRDPIVGCVRMVGSRGFDLAVVGVKRGEEEDDHMARTTAATLLNDLPCETVFLRVAD